MSDTGEVVFEMQAPGGWRKLGSQSAIEPPGSFSACERLGRQVYVFGWLPTGEGPGVWRSLGGADTATPAIRRITTAGFDQVADLAAGPHEMVWHRCPAGSARIRFCWSGAS